MNGMARVVVGESSNFRHRFGGMPTYNGIVPPRNSQPLHLLYTFDTNDPLFPVSIPGIRYLPLFYCFPYNAGDLGYRMISEDQIEILHLTPKRTEPNFPYPNYPDHFSETSVKLVPITYEEHKTLVHYLTYEQHFLKSFLSETDRNFIKENAYPFTQLGGIQRMWQGIPEINCPNKRCENHKLGVSQEVFAVVWNQPVPDVFLWSEDSDDEIQIIFQICTNCQAISVCNRCT